MSDDALKIWKLWPPSSAASKETNSVWIKVAFRPQDTPLDRVPGPVAAASLTVPEKRGTLFKVDCRLDDTRSRL